MTNQFDDNDAQEILAVHKLWWKCNRTGDIPAMATCFPTGMNYLMFNLNGHPYYGLDEKVALWEWYSGKIEIARPDIRVVQMAVEGRMGWVASEGSFPTRLSGSEEGTGSKTWAITSHTYQPSPIRATEVYRKDDGDGNEVWKIWHFHCSPHASADELRPGFGDSGFQRGLGYTPWPEQRHAATSPELRQ